MIDLQPSSEQEQIIDSVAALLRDRLPLDRLRSDPAQPTAAAEVNRDASAFAQIGELGVFGLGLAQDLGGVGYGLIEEVLVAREFGRALVSPSVIATMLAVHVAAGAGALDLAGRMQGGALVVAQAVALSPASPAQENEFYLLDLEQAEWVLAWTENGLTLAPIAAWSDQRTLAAIDSTVTLTRATLKEADGAIGDRSPAILDRCRLLAASYLVGIAEAALEDTLSYVRLREQFGRPIGSFQAVKHRCADMMARASAGWNLTLFAALSAADGMPDSRFQTLAAKIIASDAASRNAAIDIQNHGGIGFTREHYAHLFVKRAHLFDLIGGSTPLLKKRLLAEPSPFAPA